jgi:hypothetical protein
MKYLFTYKLFENITKMLKTNIWNFIKFRFLDVKIKEVFVGKNKKILQHLNIHNVFKISITLKKGWCRFK